MLHLMHLCFDSNTLSLGTPCSCPLFRFSRYGKALSHWHVTITNGNCRRGVLQPRWFLCASSLPFLTPPYTDDVLRCKSKLRGLHVSEHIRVLHTWVALSIDWRLARTHSSIFHLLTPLPGPGRIVHSTYNIISLHSLKAATGT